MAGWRMPTPEELEAEEREEYGEYVEDMSGADVLTFEEWRMRRAESAHERAQEAYYGSGAPQTDLERTQEAHRQKHGRM